MAKFLVTGASGFIGRAIVNSLLTAGDSVVAVVRERPDFLPDSAGRRYA